MGNASIEAEESPAQRHDSRHEFFSNPIEEIVGTGLVVYAFNSS